MSNESIQAQLCEWQDKLNFYKEEEAKIFDLDQKFVANKKIKEATKKISELKIALSDNVENQGNSFLEVKDSTEIETMHEALDLFMQQKDKLSHKSTDDEVEELETLKNKFLESFLGEYIEKVKTSPLLRNKKIIYLFETIFASEKLSTQIIIDINDVRQDKTNYTPYDRSVIISAITLSVLSWKKFDSNKMHLLLDFMSDFEDDQVWQKALVGVILSAIVHQNRLRRHQLIKPLQSLKNIEKVQIGIYIIDLIMRNQLYDRVVSLENIEKDHFLNDTPYNWFYPFHIGNDFLNKTLDETEYDLNEDEFIDFIHKIPLIDALKYSICNNIKNSKPLVNDNPKELQKEELNNVINIINKKLSLANQLEPYYNFIAEIYSYFKIYPKDRVDELFDKKITISQTKLKNIILGKLQSLKLAADLHFENNEFKQCISKLKELLNIKPNQLSALDMISDCYIKREEYGEALSYALQLDKADTNNKDNFYRIGFCLNMTHQYKKSNDHLLKDESFIDTNPEFLNIVSKNYQSLKDYQNAIKYADKAILNKDKGTNRDYKLSILYLCNSYSELKQFPTALEYSLILLSLEEQNPSYMIIVGEIHEEMGEYEKALDYISKAHLLQKENDVSKALRYGRILLLNKKFYEAEIVLKRLLRNKESESYYGVIYGNIGHLYLFQKDFLQAEEFYQKCVLEFDDIQEFEGKFDLDLKHALNNDITEERYNNIKTDMIEYWEENK